MEPPSASVGGEVPFASTLGELCPISDALLNALDDLRSTTSCPAWHVRFPARIVWKPNKARHRIARPKNLAHEWQLTNFTVCEQLFVYPRLWPKGPPPVFSRWKWPEPVAATYEP